MEYAGERKPELGSGACTTPKKSARAQVSRGRTTFSWERCCAVLPMSSHSGPAFQSFLTTYGWIPAQFSLALTQGQFPVSSAFFACLFLHGGGLHLVGNLLFLFFLGNAVEARLGAVRYLVLYLGGNVIALLTPGGDDTVFLDPNDRFKWGRLPLSPASIVCFFSQPRSPTPPCIPLPGLLKELLRPSSWGGWIVPSCGRGYLCIRYWRNRFLFLDPYCLGGLISVVFLGGLILGPLLLSFPERRRRRPAVDIVPFLLNRPNSLLR